MAHNILLQAPAPRTQSWHLATETRVLCTLVLLVTIVATPNGHWLTWSVYALALGGLLKLTQIPLGGLLKRLAVEFSFVGVVLLGALFREEGQVLWRWGWLQVTDTGLVILGSVALKALLSLVLLNVLTLSTPVPLLLSALVTLRVPPLLVAILAAMYRYLDVLIEEFTTMSRAAKARNLLSRRNWQRLVIGNMIGSLFIRTLERGERIHRAMLARGYQGLPTRQQTFAPQQHDWLALIGTGLLALLGQGLYWFSG